MINFFTDKNYIESNAMSIIDSLANNEFVIDIDVFPDVHISTMESIPVGVSFTTFDNVIFPLVSGKDIGCGVSFCSIPKNNFLKKIDKNNIYKAFYQAHLTFTDEGLGGGNHFLSIEEDDENIFFICHTGTRNNGIAFYQKTLHLLEMYNQEADKNVRYIETEYINKTDQLFFNDYDNLLNYGKKRRNQFISNTINWFIKNGHLNKNVIFEISDSIHNYFEFQNDGSIIHRKGVTGINDIVVCPISMLRGSFIVKKNSQSTNNSCAHGAGRSMSRADAINYWYNTLKNKERKWYYENYSEYLVNGDFSKDIVSEFDFAYKSTEDWLKNQPHIIKITSTKPIITIKFIL